MISINIVKDGKLMQLCMGIDFDKEIDLNGINTGTAFIAFIDDNRDIQEIIKKKLIYPGSSKIVIFLLTELKNDKIKTYIKNG